MAVGGCERANGRTGEMSKPRVLGEGAPARSSEILGQPLSIGTTRRTSGSWAAGRSPEPSFHVKRERDGRRLAEIARRVRGVPRDAKGHPWRVPGRGAEKDLRARARGVARERWRWRRATLILRTNNLDRGVALCTTCPWVRRRRLGQVRVRGTFHVKHVRTIISRFSEIGAEESPQIVETERVGRPRLQDPI